MGADCLEKTSCRILVGRNIALCFVGVGESEVSAAGSPTLTRRGGGGSPRALRLHIAFCIVAAPAADGGRPLESGAVAPEWPRQSLIRARGLNGRRRLFPRPVCGTMAGSEKVLGAQVDDYGRCYGLRLVIGTVDVQAA